MSAKCLGMAKFYKYIYLLGANEPWIQFCDSNIVIIDRTDYIDINHD